MANASYVRSLVPNSPHQPHCNLTKILNVPTTIREPKSPISAGILSLSIKALRHQSLGPCLSYESGTHEGKGVLPFAIICELKTLIEVGLARRHWSMNWTHRDANTHAPLRATWRKRSRRRLSL